MHMYQEEDSDNNMVQYQYIYSLWMYDTSKFTSIYILYTIWAILSVFILHLIQTRRSLSILDELDWFNLDSSKSPKFQSPINDRSRNSISDNSRSEDMVKYSDYNTNINIIHANGDCDIDKESIKL